jgi:methylated-DNA-[protein]-cysteine S-methyltransferase
MTLGGVLDFDVVVKAPFGGIGVRTEGGVVSEAVYLPASIAPRPARHALAKEAARQIARYWKDPAFAFDLPLAERGTAFQRRVWKVICAIPSGTTLSYGGVARKLRTGPRAVGGACGANWFSLIIPCHRVLASNGLGGFGDASNEDAGRFHLNIKRWLLAHEGVAGHEEPHA